MDAADQTPEGPDDVAQGERRWRWSGLGGAVFLFAGVILPAICFAMAKDFSPPWQTGAKSDYAVLLLAWRPSSPFYPLLLYSMTSMSLLVFWFDRGANVFIVRLGIYAGVLLAAQYFCIVAMVHPGVAIVGTVIALVSWGFGWLFHRLLGSRKPLVRADDGEAAGTRILVIVSLLVLVSAGAFFWAFPFFLFACAACAPPWAVFAYSAMANHLVRRRRGGQWQFSLAQLLGAVAWFAAWCGAWRISVERMLNEYAKLPTSAPGCYVATAAARGHRRWVRSENVVGPVGEVRRVNDQLRYLKAFELVWARVAPRGHRRCRRCYDRLGPAAAAMLIHPLVADFAYAALKPAEWIARATPAVLVPGGGELAQRLYRR